MAESGVGDPREGVPPPSPHFPCPHTILGRSPRTSSPPSFMGCATLSSVPLTICDPVVRLLVIEWKIVGGKCERIIFCLNCKTLFFTFVRGKLSKVNKTNILNMMEVFVGSNWLYFPKYYPARSYMPHISMHFPPPEVELYI